MTTSYPNVPRVQGHEDFEIPAGLSEEEARQHLIYQRVLREVNKKEREDSEAERHRRMAEPIAPIEQPADPELQRLIEAGERIREECRARGDALHEESQQRHLLTSGKPPTGSVH